MILGVYVPSNHRGKGIAKNLMKEIMSRGKEIEGLEAESVFENNNKL